MSSSIYLQRVSFLSTTDVWIRVSLSLVLTLVTTQRCPASVTTQITIYKLIIVHGIRYSTSANWLFQSSQLLKHNDTITVKSSLSAWNHCKSWQQTSSYNPYTKIQPLVHSFFVDYSLLFKTIQPLQHIHKLSKFDVHCIRLATSYYGNNRRRNTTMALFINLFNVCGTGACGKKWESNLKKMYLVQDFDLVVCVVLLPYLNTSHQMNTQSILCCNSLAMSHQYYMAISVFYGMNPNCLAGALHWIHFAVTRVTH